MRCWFIIVLLFFSSYTFGQYYSHTYYLNYGNDNLVRDIEIENDTLYIVTGDICFDIQMSCMTISSLDANTGELINSTNRRGFKGGNEDILHLEGDTLLISGLSREPLRRTVVSARTDKQFSFLDTFSVSPRPDYSYFNEGILKHQNSFYTYGNGGIIDTDTIYGYILKWDKNFENIIDQYYFYPFDQENQLDDLQVTPEGDLVFINNGEKSGFSNDFTNITTIDTLGNLLSQFELQNEDLNERNLILTDEGHYVLIDGVKDPPWRKKIMLFQHSSFKKLWETEFYSEDYWDQKLYSINDLDLAQNGDILGCGQLVQAGDDDSYHSGFIFRMDALTGDFIWWRVYHNWNEAPEQFEDVRHHSWFRQIKELPNGDLMVVGRVDKQTINSVPENHLWLLRVGTDGCLFSETCDTLNYTTNTIDLYSERKSDISVSPNPCHDNITISLPLSEKTRLCIYDNQGRKIKTIDITDSQFSLDTGMWDTGMYIFTFASSAGTYQKSILKH